MLAQVVFTTLTLALVFSVFGVILFANFGSNGERYAYACLDPTQTPVPINITVIDRCYYYPDDDPEGYLREGINKANEFLDDYHIKLVCPTIQDSALFIKDVSATRMYALTEEYGKRWSDNESVWFLVGAIEGAWGALTTKKKTGLATINGWKMTFLEQGHDSDQLAKTILHELGHEAGLNHTGDSNNLMYPSYNSNYGLSTSIAETETAGGFYGQPASATRDQEAAFENILDYNDQFSGW